MRPTTRIFITTLFSALVLAIAAERNLQGDGSTNTEVVTTDEPAYQRLINPNFLAINKAICTKLRFLFSTLSQEEQEVWLTCLTGL
jgi:hypothetical protein